MLRALSPPLVIDVGANRGQFALDVLQACPNARVVAFEPHPSEAAVARGILGSSSRFDVRTTALGDEPGQSILCVSAESDSSSMLPSTARQTQIWPATMNVGEIGVPVSTLDDEFESSEIPSGSLLKIDVQGFELKVLRGALKTLRRVSWVYVEVSFEELYQGQPLAAEVIRFLDGAGFQLRHTGPRTTVDGLSIQADLLFKSSEPTQAPAIAI